jgi:hypothetical protein
MHLAPVSGYIAKTVIDLFCQALAKRLIPEDPVSVSQKVGFILCWPCLHSELVEDMQMTRKGFNFSLLH